MIRNLKVISLRLAHEFSLLVSLDAYVGSKLRSCLIDGSHHARCEAHIHLHQVAWLPQLTIFSGYVELGRVASWFLHVATMLCVWALVSTITCIRLPGCLNLPIFLDTSSCIMLVTILNVWAHIHLHQVAPGCLNLPKFLTPNKNITRGSKGINFWSHNFKRLQLSIPYTHSHVDYW